MEFCGDGGGYTSALQGVAFERLKGEDRCFSYTLATLQKYYQVHFCVGLWKNDMYLCHGLTWKLATRTTQPLTCSSLTQWDGEENKKAQKLVG